MTITTYKPSNPIIAFLAGLGFLGLIVLAIVVVLAGLAIAVAFGVHTVMPTFQAMLDIFQHKAPVNSTPAT